MSKVRKFLAALGGVIAIAVDAQADGIITGYETESIVLGLVTAGLVWLIPNKEDTVVEVDEISQVFEAIRQGLEEQKKAPSPSGDDQFGA